MNPTNRGETFSFPVNDIRSLPFPDQCVSDGGRKAKRVTLFASVDDIPEKLTEWTEVNPRKPLLDKNNKLKGVVAKRLITTLIEDPEKFVLKNIGIFILAKDVSFQKEEGGKGTLEVVLEDREHHGVVNGGHSLRAILEARETDGYQPGQAFVPLHILVGIKNEYIVHLAEGLNRSLQVNDPSLANLDGTFDEIKTVMAGKPGSDQIVYRQGDEGDVDVLWVLTLLGCFNLDAYPDRKKHPNDLFGQSKRLLQEFEADEDNGFKTFKKIIAQLPDILVLSDRIQQLAFENCAATISRRKVSASKKNNRAANPKYRRDAYFAGGEIRGKFFEGWLLPMVAAFRAAVSRKAWDKGKFEWLVEPEELLQDVIEELVEIVMREHENNNDKPAEVGRKDSAYRLCYSTVSLALARAGKVVA